MRLLQPWNVLAESPVNEDGSFTVVSLVHPENTSVPMDDILSGHVIVFNDVQLLNTFVPSFTIEFGNETSVIFVFPAKTLSPISVTILPSICDGIVIFASTPTYFVMRSVPLANVSYS